MSQQLNYFIKSCFIVGAEVYIYIYIYIYTYIYKEFTFYIYKNIYLSYNRKLFTLIKLENGDYMKLVFLLIQKVWRSF